MGAFRTLPGVLLGILVLCQFNLSCSGSSIDVENNSAVELVLAELESMKSEVKALKALQSEVKALKVEIESLKTQSCLRNDFVSFTAITSTDRAYATGESIVFDNVLRNYGTAYNASGVFTCPITGYYLFFVNVYTSQGQEMTAEVYIQDQEETPELVTPQSGWDNGSNLVVSECTAGSEVSVRVTDRQGSTATSGLFRVNSFTGILLSQYE